jgi:DNA modification methylase
MEINNIYCTECVAGMRKLPNNFVDLTVTSPPYDNLRTYNGFAWDFESTAKELYRITKDGGVVVWVVGDATIKGSETGTSFRQALYFKDIGFNLHDTMIYQKNGTGACGSNKCYWQAFEYMFVFSKGRIKTVNRLTTGKKQTSGGGSRIKRDGSKKTENREFHPEKEQLRSNVWLYSVGKASGDDEVNHPAKFPEQLAGDHILSWSNPGDLVFDPFMGSGTTAKMAVANGRNFLGFDISEEYCKIAKDRVNQYILTNNLQESYRLIA